MDTTGATMVSELQGTIKRTVSFAGVGLHTGRTVNVEIFPTCANTGIIFHRTDRADARPILAHAFNVSSTDLCTSIGPESSSISTIEHLMAAFSGLGVDNALVRVDSCELPILDGSSAPFVDKLREVGIERQPFCRKQFVVKTPFEIRDGDNFIRVVPAANLQFSCSIDFSNSSAIGKQHLAVKFDEKSFLDLCEARTFCHIDDVTSMRAAGLARGGSLDNAVVVNDSSVVNADGLRFDDEFVRHKILDCIGDLALLGGRLVGKVITHRSGHALHARFTDAILRNQDSVLKVVSNSIGATKMDVGRENGAEGLGLVAQQLMS